MIISIHITQSHKSGLTSAPRASFRDLASAAAIASTRPLESQLGNLHRFFRDGIVYVLSLLCSLLLKWFGLGHRLGQCAITGFGGNHPQLTHKDRYKCMFTGGECNTEEGGLSPSQT